MSVQGFLVTHAYTSNARIPVEDVTVTVTRRTAAGIPELLAIRQTDESGKTEPLALDTPEEAASLSPDSGTGFLSVDLTAQHPLYERIIVESVQIFPDTVTLQDFQLIPLAEAPDIWNQTEFFDIPPQNL